jgi:hypothetical protein
MAVDAIGHETFLDPARAEFLDARTEIDRVVQVEALPAIDHQVVVVAERFAQRAHQGDILVEAFIARHRPVADEPFLRGIALGLVSLRPLADFAEILDGVAEHRGVGRHLVARRTAQNAPDRLRECLSLEIPQGAVDRGDSDHRKALAPVNLQAVHLIPQQFDGERVLVQDDRRKLREDKMRSIPPHRTGRADDAIISVNFDEVGVDLQMMIVDLRSAFPRLLIAIFGIDINGANEPLLPERSVGRERSVHATDLDLRDLPLTTSLPSIPAPPIPAFAPAL